MLITFMPKEQHHTVASPLSELVKPDTLRQEALFPAFMPRDTSRFSLRRIAFHLRRTAADITRFTSRDGSPGHLLKTQEGTAGSPSSSLAWTEGEKKTLRAQVELPGDLNMQTEPGRLIFISETGATLCYGANGAILYSPTPPRRARLAEEQAALPWYEQSPEVVNKKIIELDATVVSKPDFGLATKKNTPYASFPIAIAGTEQQFAVYAYQQGVSLVRRRNLKPGDPVHLRASVQIDRQYVAKDETIERRWLRLFNLVKQQVG